MAGRSEIGPSKLVLSSKGGLWTAAIIEIATNREIFYDEIPANSHNVAAWEADLKAIPIAQIVEVERFI